MRKLILIAAMLVLLGWMLVPLLAAQGCSTGNPITATNGGTVVLHKNGTRVDVSISGSPTPTRCLTLTKLNRSGNGKYQWAQGGGNFGSTTTLSGSKAKCFPAGVSQVSVKNIESGSDSDIRVDFPANVIVKFYDLATSTTCGSCKANLAPLCQIY